MQSPSVDSQMPNREMSRMDDLVAELRDMSGDMNRDMKDTVKNTTLLIRQALNGNEDVNQRCKILRQKHKVLSDLISIAQGANDAPSIDNLRHKIDKAKQVEFEAVLGLVIEEDGSLDRIRKMSKDAMVRLKNEEKDAAVRELEGDVKSLMRTTNRLRDERREAREARDLAMEERERELIRAREAEEKNRRLDEKNKKVKDEMAEMAEEYEKAKDTMMEKLKEYKAELKTSNDALEMKRKAFDKAMRDIIAHSATEARLRGLLNEMQLQVGDKDEELSRLRKEREGLVEEKQGLLHDNSDAERKFLVLKEEHDQLVTTLERNANKAAVASRDHERQVEQLKEEAQEARDEFDQRIQQAEGAWQIKTNKSRRSDDKRKSRRSVSGGEVEDELATKSVALTEMETQQTKVKKDLEAKSLALTEMEGQREMVREELAAKSLALKETEDQRKKVEEELITKSLTLTEMEDQRNKVKEELAAKSLALTETEYQREKVKGELASKSLALTEMEDQRKKVEEELAAKSLALTKTALVLTETEDQREKVKEELAAKSLALTEMKGQQQQTASTNKVIKEKLARVFMAQSGCPRAELGRWISFVQMAGEADFVSCGDQLTEDGVWTILQQWDSQTVALSTVAIDTIEGLLVRLYGKVGESEMDDEAVDLVRRLVMSTGTIGQVPFSLVCHVVGECLDLLEGVDYHSVAIAFGLRQLMSIVSVRCSQDVGELQQRLEGMLSNQSTPLGALSALLASHQSGLKDRIRGGQISLPDGSEVPVRYCPAQDIGVLVLPGSAGYVWALELATNGIRRVVGSRLTVVENYEWRLRGIEGQYITLPSDDWEVNCEMIGGA
ncbi:hypothetical protein CIB48_g10611 [Xylaria polymorpha]|nr:hypothetical protein CIB48_g10611 [Xylaria polymorpha]